MGAILHMTGFSGGTRGKISGNGGKYIVSVNLGWFYYNTYMIIAKLFNILDKYFNSVSVCCPTTLSLISLSLRSQTEGRRNVISAGYINGGLVDSL